MQNLWIYHSHRNSCTVNDDVVTGFVSEVAGVFIDDDGLVVVQALRLQDLRQVTLAPVRLLQLRSLVLEPDLDLIVVETKLDSESPPPLLGQVPVCGELVLQPLQLIRAERGPGSLVRGAHLLSRRLLLKRLLLSRLCGKRPLALPTGLR